MYVGMTRPKHNLHIIADPHAVSPLVSELLSAWDNINVISQKFKQDFQNLFKCPHCVEGYLKKFSSKYGEFYACSMGGGARWERPGFARNAAIRLWMM